MVLHALFYPPTGLVLLPVVAGSALLAARFAIRRQFKALCRVALACLPFLILLLLFGTRSPEIGRVLPIEDARLMREFLQGGRLPELPFPGLAGTFWNSFDIALRSHYRHGAPSVLSVFPLADPWPVLFFAVSLLLGWFVLLRSRPVLALETALVVGSAFLLFFAGRVLAFRLGFPDRFFFFVLPVLFAFFPALVLHAARASRELWGLALFAAMVSLLAAPWQRSNVPGKIVDTSEHQPLLGFIRELPPQTLVTAWPAAVLDDIPLLAHREVLFNYENAHPLYFPFYQHIQDRALDTVRLAFSLDASEAAALRDTHGLTHLVLRHDLFDPNKRSPGFFSPIDEAAAYFRRQRLAKNPIFARPDPAWVVYQDDGFRVIDLTRLEAGPKTPPPPEPGPEPILRYPLDVEFHGLEVVGGVVRPGGEVHLDVHWRTPAIRTFTRWVVFVHFRHEGRNVFGADHGLFFTLDREAQHWTLDAPMDLSYRHSVRAPDTLPEGELHVYLGIFNPLDGRRIHPVCGTPTDRAAFDTGLRIPVVESD